MFMAIGLLLYVFYCHPEVMGPPRYAVPGANKAFLSFILHEMPAGLRGLMLSGLFAVAFTSLLSALNAMAATSLNDCYRPLMKRADPARDLRVGRLAVALWGAVLGGFACLCVGWQRSNHEGLLDFALGVMSFAYAGLLAVFLTALFTRRGTARSAIAALITGFAVITVLQPAVWQWLTSRPLELAARLAAADRHRAVLPGLPRRAAGGAAAAGATAAGATAAGDSGRRGGGGAGGAMNPADLPPLLLPSPRSLRASGAWLPAASAPQPGALRPRLRGPRPRALGAQRPLAARRRSRRPAVRRQRAPAGWCARRRRARAARATRSTPTSPIPSPCARARPVGRPWPACTPPPTPACAMPCAPWRSCWCSTATACRRWRSPTPRASPSAA